MPDEPAASPSRPLAPSPPHDESAGAAPAALSVREEVLPAGPRQRGRRLPTHFVVGTVLLYLLVLGTFLLAGSPLRRIVPEWRTFVPLAAGISFYVASNLFLLILGRGTVSRWTVLKAMAMVLVLAMALSLALRAQFVYERVDPSATATRALLSAVVDFKRALFAGEGLFARAVRFAGMILLEEAVKLLPVVLLIARRRITSAHAAVLCGTLAGLTFGTVEAISYGYLIYPASGEALPVYLTRFFIMSPLHGIWTGLAGALVFLLSATAVRGIAAGKWQVANGTGGGGRQADGAGAIGAGAYGAAYAVAVVLHVAHNSLQEIIGAAMQIVTVFALLAPLYQVAKVARRQATRDGAAGDETELLGDLHVLTVSVATLFLALSITFSWIIGVGPPPAR